MSEKNIIAKLKTSGLTGRSGSGFPTGLKWEAIKKAKGKEKYVICNGAEGEPEVFKDKFILENYPKEVVEGVKIATEALKAKAGYIYLKGDYYEKIGEKLKAIIGKDKITIFKKPLEKYIGGEETSVIEAIEGKRMEPRQKPPYVTESGLFNCPTLVNNVETFYFVSKIAKDEYKKTRFYCISGAVKNKGVYEFSESWTVEKILKESGNFPDFEFFAKVGGGVCGKVFLKKELGQKICGAGSIIIYDLQKTDSMLLMQKWAEFFSKQNCDKCVPCREGAYRISEIVKKGKIEKEDMETLEDLFFVLQETSFCSLGKGMPAPFKYAISKLLEK